jgi:hypothetical protein
MLKMSRGMTRANGVYSVVMFFHRTAAESQATISALATCPGFGSFGSAGERGSKRCAFRHSYICCWVA